eukprot:COSAG06_NODE_3078_length_5888_cov_24.975643_10_plen_202_part_00
MQYTDPARTQSHSAIRWPALSVTAAGLANANFAKAREKCGLHVTCSVCLLASSYILCDAMPRDAINAMVSPSPSAGSIPAAACSLSATSRLQNGRAPIAYSQRSDKYCSSTAKFLLLLLLLLTPPQSQLPLLQHASAESASRLALASALAATVAALVGRGGGSQIVSDVQVRTLVSRLSNGNVSQSKKTRITTRFCVLSAL